MLCVCEWMRCAEYVLWPFSLPISLCLSVSFCRRDHGLHKPQPDRAQVLIVGGGASERVPVRHDPLQIHLPNCKHVEITRPRARFGRAFLTIPNLSPLWEPHLESWTSSKNGSRTSEISVGSRKSSRGSGVSLSLVEHIQKKNVWLLFQKIFVNHLAF